MLRALWPGIRFSSVYRAAAREEMQQPEFLNAVASIETKEDPWAVFQKMQIVEQALKKAPPYRYGPRTIDLDLLFYEDRAPETPGITLPHPKMAERRFVLEPLCELVNPDETHPLLHRTWRELLEKTSDQPCTRTDITL